MGSTDPSGAALAISRAVFPCAHEVVISPAGDLQLTALGAQLAAARRGPLLLAGAGTDDVLLAEIERLAPRRVTVIGGVALPALPAAVEVEAVSETDALVELVDDALGSGIRVEIGTEGVGAVARILRPIATGNSVWLPGRGVGEECDPDDPAAQASIDRRANSAEPAGDLWLVDICSPSTALAAAAAARSTGDTVLLIDGRDLRTSRALVEVVPGDAQPEQVVLFGEMTPEAEWQVAALLADHELPGGGLTLFPGRRIVALYGNPTTPALGVMGEQGPAEAVQRAREVAAPYGTDGTEVLPAFEIIATVASAKATDDGNYSWEMSNEELRPWVEMAAQEGLYVVLDLQPGRTDFLTQAQRYEELLLLPHVGLALDPEWRLKPNQVHLRQIGSVDAEEVNQVVEWLAALVRDNHLPQKLLILHQFKLSMITNRDMIHRPPELAMMVHADGQGPIHTKYDTYDALTALPDVDRWWWGWKNFYDEDTPTPTAEQVLELDPLPVYVSYQ
jgi:hypothetical protein